MSEHPTDEHSSFIKTPKQLIIAVALAFVVPIALILLLTQLATRNIGATPEDPAQSEEAIARRLKPVGEVVIAEAQGPRTERSPQQIVETVCAACHVTGALNAPKIGDKPAWKSLIAEGLDHLTENAIKGIRAMPPRGGNPNLTDSEVARAVAYMANQSGASFKMPEPVPAAAPEQVAKAPAGQPTAPVPAKEAAAPPAKAAPAGKGKSVYDTACAACHTTGIAGAPKTGDKTGWGPRLKAGIDALYVSAIKGKGTMPPKGGNPTLADDDVKAAVDYMVGTVK